MTTKEYQDMEIRRFRAEMADKGRLFVDSVKDVSEAVEDAEWTEQQLDWLANGSFGAGACFELQRRLALCGPRSNRAAVVGRMVLSCLYGHDRADLWRKLSVKAKGNLGRVVKAWLAGQMEFGQIIEK
jgi:hypothetical protein